MTISEATIAAYVDGELGEAEARVVEAAAAEDAAVAERLQKAAALRARLAGAYSPILDEPPPEALLQLVKTAGDAAGRPPRFSRPWTWGAIAASWLVAGLIGAVGMQMLKTGPYASGEAGLQAGRRLSSDLTSLPVGELSPGGTRIVFSFRRADAVCRAFTREGDSGVACREPGGWRIAILAPGAPQASGDYRQAASALPDPVLAFVDAEMVGERLSPEEEGAARARGWRL
ncbi:MAG TPA: hypothetical protein VIP08_16950 [Phenylobacterium sp.]|uniref:hypothetical protein n=1 Tax=Phenylobacterium sp. TaxID=1871053 RepID=UPI002F9314E0